MSPEDKAMTDTLTDFVVCGRQVMDPPRETPDDLYIAAICDLNGRQHVVQGGL